MGCGVLVSVGVVSFYSFYLIFMYLVIPKDFSPEESASPLRTADSSPLKWFGMTGDLGVSQLRSDGRKKQVARLGNHSRGEWFRFARNDRVCTK